MEKVTQFSKSKIVKFKKGRFGTVYRATHRRSNITRAIKIIDKGKFFQNFVENEFADVDELIKAEFELLRSMVYFLS